MGSVILDGAEIGEGAFIGAGSLVPPGKVIPPNMLAMGRPAKVVREVQKKTAKIWSVSFANTWKKDNTISHYKNNSIIFHTYLLYRRHLKIIVILKSE